MLSAKNMWLELAQIEQRSRTRIMECNQLQLECIHLRKQLELLMTEEDIRNIRDEEENRDLTIAALRHTRCDPTGKFTEVDFSVSKKKPQAPKKSYTPKKDYEETEEDRWLTERSHEFAKNA